MRVLLVHDRPLETGYGAERYVARLAAGLRAAGDEVEVIAGEVTHAGAGRALDLWDPAARRLVTRRAASFAADVVHLHNVTRELSPSVIAAAPDLPKVMTFHDLRLLGAAEHGFGPRRLAEAAQRRTTLRLARRHVAVAVGVSERVSDALRRNGFSRVATVPVPVDDPVAETRPATECADVGVVARLEPDKGVDVVIDAFAALAFDVPRSRLLIAGDGPERERLERRAAPLGDRVGFLGRLGPDEVSRLLGGVRVVVVASVPGRRPEGSSLALAEAAAHARPVLASDDPAVVELATELGNVLTVPAGDTPAFTAALRGLLADDATVSRLGAAGRDGVAARHSRAAVTAASREIYRTVSGQR